MIELREFSIPQEDKPPLVVQGRIVLRADGGVEFPAAFPNDLSDIIADAFSAFALARVRRNSRA